MYHHTLAISMLLDDKVHNGNGAGSRRERTDRWTTKTIDSCGGKEGEA